MTRLPTVSGKEATRALRRLGYEEDHRTGSHIILRQGIPPYRRLTVPDHKALAKGTLRAVLRQAGLTINEFLDLLG